MSDCIFCKIVNKEIPSIKVREDNNFIAILDIFPNTKGQTLVLPKAHQDSNIALVDEKMSGDIMIATQKVIHILRKGLGVERVGVIIEGLAVPHLHVRLYPFYNDIGFENGIHAGPQANVLELQQLANEILHNTSR